MIFFCLICIALSGKVVEYRLSTNYGNTIYDHSGNGITGYIRNGASLSTGIVFTDRGFYIGSKSAIAPLSAGMTQMPNPCTILFWLLTDSTAGRLMHSISNSNALYHFRLFKSSSDKLRIEYITTSSNVLVLSDSTFISNEWVLMSVTLSDTFYIFKQNGQTLASIDMGSKINNGYWVIIGWDLNAYPVVKGFLWYYAIVDYENAEVDFIGTGYEICFLETCSVCNTYIYDDVSNESGCISVNQDVGTDAGGNTCLTTKPCRDNKVIECLCESKSCSYESIDEVYCIQINSHEFLRASGICDQDGQGCCLDICKECSNMTACITCLEDNAFVDDDGLCTCKPGYYGDRPLNFTGSCTKCADECSECDNSTICTICIDPNAYPSLTGCVCKDGFWSAGDTSQEDNCKECNSECKTCSDNSSCIKCATEGTYYLTNQGCCLEICSECSNETACTACLSENAFVDDDGHCTCDAGYYGNRPLNSWVSCSKCADECLECDNSYICTTCIDQNAYPTPIGCLCKDGFWSAGNTTLADNCKACNSECKTCNNNSSCIECELDNSVFINGGCECIDGFRPKMIGGKYVCSDKCFLGCSICERCECKSCFDLNAVLTSDEKCECKDGYYKNDSETNLDKVCVKCSYGCASCTSSLNCNFCEDLFILTDNSCICEPGYYSYNSANDEDIKCNKCPFPCEECSNEKKCDSCKKNFKLIENKCLCISGYTLSKSACTQNYFECSLLISETNILKFKFNETLLNPLKESEITLAFENKTKIAFKLHKSSLKFCILIPMLPNTLVENTTVIAEFSTYPMLSIKKSILKEYSFKGLLNKIKFNSNFTEIEIIQDSTYAVLALSVATVFIINPLFLWNFLNALEIIRFLPITTNEITPEIRKICSELSVTSHLTNFQEKYMNVKSSSTPSKEVQDCNIENSPFFVNSAKELLILIFFIALLPLLLLLNRISEEYFKSSSKKVKGIIKNYRYNFFIRFFLQIYLTFGVYGIVQIKSVIISKEKLSSGVEYYFNQMSAIVFLILFSIAPCVIMTILCVHEAEIETQDTTIIERYGTLFFELKSEKGLRFSIFWVLFTLRRAQYLLTQFYMNFNYIAQASLNLGFTILIIGYYLTYRPLKRSICLLNSICSEVCVGICFALVLFLVSFESEESRDLINKIFLYTILGFLGFQVLLSIIVIYIGLKKIWTVYEKKRALKFLSRASAINLEK